MPVAEVFLSAFVTVLFEKLSSGVLSNLASRGGIHSQLEKWKRNLLTIQAVISDAEEKQITKSFVQMWLDDLQDLAYDLDDILDDLIAKASRLEMEPQVASTGKVKSFVPTCCTSFTSSAFMLNYTMRSKLEEITNRLQDLAKRKNDLGLKEDMGGMSSRSNRTGERMPTTSLVDKSRVCGREIDKEEVLKLLFGAETHSDCEVCVIPIVGMGGVGKTTLAQLVYNDEKVKGSFDLKAWVCVSDEFDVFVVTRIIFEAVAQKSCDFKDLNMVQESLMKILAKKKFLLVLDDVWNENYGKWDLLRIPFQVGAPGSKIIVTTRNEGVASIMGSVPTYYLKELTNDHFLSVLAQHALGTRDFEAHLNLKVIGEDIARKCKGLPLAAKTLGGLLRTKLTPSDWQDISNSNIWDLQEQKSDILPALRLSYYHLPPYLKHIFAYCSIFPKDYQFDKNELVLLWMAEGFLRQSNGNKQMEELGFEYFNELLSRSFFQHCGESQFVMHDLMSDLAQFVAGGICFRLDDKMKSNQQNTISEKARHSSFIRHKYEVFNKFKAFYKVRGLRTFLPLPVYRSEDKRGFYLSNRVVHDLLPKLKFLRVLSLSGYSITELSASIGDLKHLRYLNLSRTLIKQLPESVSDLYYLQTLSLRSCSKLSKLPTSIGNLINLRHLDIADTEELQEMPLGICNLTSLKTLSKIVLDKSNTLGITELRGLWDLRGTLSIIGLHNVVNVQDAREASLLCKQGLEELTLIWSSEFDDSRSETLENEVLEVLKPHTNLKRIKIESYGGVEFPSWVGDPSFSNIIHLTISGCKKCRSLPSLGHLPSLKELCVRGMDGVKNVGVELHGAGCPQVLVFQSLETLSFENMVGWEEWSTNLTSNIDENVGVFPCLRELTISGCPELTKVSLPRLPSLRVLHIRGCREEVLKSIIGTASVTKLMIENIPGLLILHEVVVQSLRALEALQIVGCNELRYLWQEGSSCQHLANLGYLGVRFCPQLVSLAEEEHALPPNLEHLNLYNCGNLEKLPNWGNSLTSLRSLFICKCPRLQSFPPTTDLQSNSNGNMESFSRLEFLWINVCSSLTSFPTGGKLPATLEQLRVEDCSNLEPDSENFWLPNNSMLSSLEDIKIHGWANLKSLPVCLLSFVHLTILEIVNCPGLESFPERGLPTSLRKLAIFNCENLRSLPDDQMQRHTSLEQLLIRGCPSLESFPRGNWPPNIRQLIIGDVNQPISEWGLQRLPTSLVLFSIWGDFLELVSFTDVGSLLPTSLTSLTIWGLANLQSLSMGLQNLTSLEELRISRCPKLRSLPDKLLPTLSRLEIKNCQLLKERCLKGKRDYWPSIAHIPYVEIDLVLMHDL